jgi:tetratricopeptide (TPR) repeat protein
MSDNLDRDPLEELLAPPGDADALALRQTVLATTTACQRRRRWLRRGALATALAASFAAGMVTMRLVAPTAPASNALVRDVDPPQTHSSATAQRSDALAPKREDGPPARARQTAVLLAAGNRCLNDIGDPEAALRCYGRALNDASDDEARFSTEDNWLLMAIKNAREKEARHANHDS